MSFDVLPKATKRADGKYLADGLYYLSHGLLQARGACNTGACDVMRSLLGGNPSYQALRDARVVLTEEAVRRFLRSSNRLRMWWIADRLHRAVNQEQQMAVASRFEWGSKHSRNPTEMVFAMLELVARKDKLLP